MRNKALTHRFVDFWLLGGASILIWAIMFMFERFKGVSYIAAHFNNITYASATLAIIVNNPHFLASYRLAYSREKEFIQKNWFQLIVVPLAMILCFVVSFNNFNMPVGQFQPWVDFVNKLDGWGLNMRFLQVATLGPLIMGNLVNIMYLTVGWHYTKQTFGCMMVYAKIDDYKLTNIQRNIIRYNLLGIWWLNFVYSNLTGYQTEFYGMKYSTLDMPDFLLPLTKVILAVGILSVSYFVIYKNMKANNQKPSVNFLVPFVAMYVWWLPIFRQQEYYNYVTPFFHSLQYLVFVYRVEGNRLSQTKNIEAWTTALVFGLILSSWLSFEVIPQTMDDLFQSMIVTGVTFYIVAFNIFINVHHYFIDNVIWRMSDPKIRQRLFG